MRFAYLLAPVLGVLLVGCGPDEDRKREATPPATTEQPAAPATGAPAPDNETGGIVSPPTSTGEAGTEAGAGTGADGTAPDTGTQGTTNP